MLKKGEFVPSHTLLRRRLRLVGGCSGGTGGVTVNFFSWRCVVVRTTDQNAKKNVALTMLLQLTTGVQPRGTMRWSSEKKTKRRAPSMMLWEGGGGVRKRMLEGTGGELQSTPCGSFCAWRGCAGTAAPPSPRSQA